MVLQEESAVPVKLCRACHYAMHIAANKCATCGSVQDWQRYLGLSSTVLGLLVALVSIMTFALPIWRREFHHPTAIPLFLSFDESADHGLRLIIGNNGDAPFVLSGVFFDETSAQGVATDTDRMDIGDKADSIIRSDGVLALDARLPKGFYTQKMLLSYFSLAPKYKQGCSILLETTSPHRGVLQSLLAITDSKKCTDIHDRLARRRMVDIEAGRQKKDPWRYNSQDFMSDANSGLAG